MQGIALKTALRQNSNSYGDENAEICLYSRVSKKRGFAVPSDEGYVPFSQREGYAPIPEQLKLGEVSDDLRRQIDYYVGMEVERNTVSSYSGPYYYDKWGEVAKDFHVLFLRKSAGLYKDSPTDFRRVVEVMAGKARIEILFDFVEFFVRHPRCSRLMIGQLATAFSETRSAYRILDLKVVAIGTNEQAVAYEKAVVSAAEFGASSARKHLVAAGSALRLGNWSDSIRESIHSVESIARRMSPDAKTLAPALAKLERNGYLHGSLKSAFSALYGFSNDEEGLRHALVFKDASEVDEADALFMLGACASFVSYLISRVAAQEEVDT